MCLLLLVVSCTLHDLFFVVIHYIVSLQLSLQTAACTIHYIIL
jgi:hypothetical protein